MKRVFLASAVLAIAGCGDGGSNPVSADISRTALTGSSLPNLYVASITHIGGSNPSVTVTVCNNGPVTAGLSTTYLSHWAGLYHEGFDIYFPMINAGTCESMSRDVYPVAPGATHSYYVWADDYQEVAESNENDNYRKLEGVS